MGEFYIPSTPITHKLILIESTYGSSEKTVASHVCVAAREYSVAPIYIGFGLGPIVKGE